VTRRRIAELDRQQAEVSSFTLHLKVDAADERIPVLEQQELPAFQKRPDFIGVGAIFIGKEAPGAEGPVDQVGDGASPT
jgi:hypothetical protein